MTQLQKKFEEVVNLQRELDLESRARFNAERQIGDLEIKYGSLQNEYESLKIRVYILFYLNYLYLAIQNSTSFA